MFEDDAARRRLAGRTISPIAPPWRDRRRSDARIADRTSQVGGPAF